MELATYRGGDVVVLGNPKDKSSRSVENCLKAVQYGRLGAVEAAVAEVEARAHKCVDKRSQSRCRHRSADAAQPSELKEAGAGELRSVRVEGEFPIDDDSQVSCRRQLCQCWQQRGELSIIQTGQLLA